MYEHSYHIDFGAKAATYVDTFMDAIRWNNVEQLFIVATSGRGAEISTNHRNYIRPADSES
jgi:superoxide dismutase, Fe-Mn family